MQRLSILALSSCKLLKQINMGPFTCPSCHEKTWKLIYGSGDKHYIKPVCPGCKQQPFIMKDGLHDSFPGAQSKGLTNGKAWEIAQRVRSPEDKMTFINKSTGRETQ